MLLTRPLNRLSCAQMQQSGAYAASAGSYSYSSPQGAEQRES